MTCPDHLPLSFLLLGFTIIQIAYGQNTVNGTTALSNEGFKCLLPKHPSNGKWLILNGDYNPGDKVEINTIIKVQCNNGYLLNGLDTLYCDHNWDLSLFPICEKKCEPLYSTATTTLNCIDRYDRKIECDRAVHGTYLKYTCKEFHEIPSGTPSSFYCSDGNWDFPKPVCRPICGKKVPHDITAYVWGGTELTDYDYPWVVALFRKAEGGFKNVCGANILSRKVVVTAAHCVTDVFSNAVPKEEVKLGAGKLFNKYKDPRDKLAQYRDVEQLTVHEGYRGIHQRYVADIAILIVSEAFRLSPVVLPACFNNINDINLRTRQTGEVAGWGITESLRTSDRLRVIKIPYKDSATCARELPKEWEEQYNLFDKICAGYYGMQISVCKGDSGSGLVFKNIEDDRYYIHGLVSVAPSLQNSVCNYATNALYTSVAVYEQFINKELTKNHIEDCILPQYPRHGQWRLTNDADKKPNDVVPSNTILKFTCQEGYKLTEGTDLFECKDTYNTPSCSLICPIPRFPRGTIVSCKNRMEQIVDCSDIIDGYSMTFTCPENYQSDRGKRTSTRYCISGSFGPMPSCKSSAPSLPGVAVSTGKKKEKPTDLIEGPGVPSDKMKLICTYATWWANNGGFPDVFDPTLCTHVVYDFTGLSENGQIVAQDPALDLDTSDDPGLYRKVTDLKKRKRDLKVLLSVGGTASANTTIFGKVARSREKTAAFIENISKVIRDYNFDGLDVDWWYPLPGDKPSYIRFLKAIRKEFDKNGWLLTAAVRAQIEETGYDAAEMDKYLDWVNIKTYDFYGFWSSYSGNHNNLYPSSKQSSWEKENYSMDRTARAWKKAGLSKQKMILSVAFFARTFLLRDNRQTGVHAPVFGPGPGVDGGLLRYYEICSKYTDDFREVFDEETQSPHRFKDNIWIGFNTKESIQLKAEYIKNNGLAGVNIFPWEGDDNRGYCGERHILLKYTAAGLGHEVNWDNKTLVTT